jgi:N-acetylmuramoyl-L-alanine amidase
VKNLCVFLILLLFLHVDLKAAVDQPLLLCITFPQQSDTVDAERIRLSGYTDPGAIVSVNGKRVSLNPKGSFVTRVDLEEQMNRIIITAQKNDDAAQDILYIYRTPPLKSQPEEPTTIEQALCEPGEDIWLMAGAFLTVQMKGSPGGKASFSLDKFEKNVPMIEIDSLETNGVTGVYRGMVKIADNLATAKPLPIEFELRGRDGRKKTAEAAGKLFILSDKIPIIGQSLKVTNVHRAAERYLPFMRLPENISMQVIGREKKRFKVRFSEQQTGFVDVENIKLLTLGTPLPRTTIGAPTLSQERDWFRLIFPIDRPVAYSVEKDFQSNRLDLYLFGAQQSSHWISYPNTTIDVENLTMTQVEEYVFRTSVLVNQKRLWGYKVEFGDKTLTFSIRRPPTINPQNPLQGIIIAVDPGHGGEEFGAVSPLGMLEKDVNLRWANALASQLRRSGAEVLLTRDSDVTVSLQQRIERAEAAEAQIFISLHNNGVPPSGNAAVAEGTSTYFTLPQNKELAWAIFPQLVKLGLAPYGRVYNSYYVTNSTAFLSVLVEGGFLTHPQEELKLADSAFVDRMARAVYDGIVDFLRAQAK